MLHTKIKSTGVATIFLSGVFLFGFFSQSCQEEDEINKEVIDDHKGTEKQFQDAWNRETGKDVMEYVQPGLWDFFNEDPDPGETPVGETVELDGEPMDDDECWEHVCCYIEREGNCATATKTDDGWDWDIHNEMYSDVVDDGYYDPDIVDDYPDIKIKAHLEGPEVIQGKTHEIYEDDNGDTQIDFEPAP